MTLSSTTKRSVGVKGYTGLTFRLSRTLTRTLRIFRVPLKGILLRLPWITGVPPWSIITGAYHWKCPKGPYPRERKSKFILLFPIQDCVTTCRHWIWRTVTQHGFSFVLFSAWLTHSFSVLVVFNWTFYCVTTFFSLRLFLFPYVSINKYHCNIAGVHTSVRCQCINCVYSLCECCN